MYDTGVSDVEDPQFQSKFEETFTALSLQVPWYLVAGNHDYYGNVDAQIEYSQRSERWNFPNYYYKQTIEKDDLSLAILSIDTWRLNSGDTYVSFDPVARRGFVRDPERLERDLESGAVTEGTYRSITRNFPSLPERERTTRERKARAFRDDEQLLHLEQWLRDTRDYTWVIVQGHFPIYSCTTDEHGNTDTLIRDLFPLLVAYNVTAYFSGHDHVLQHISKEGLHMLGSGTGARSHRGINEKFDGLVHADQGVYGFMVHKLTKATFLTTFVANDSLYTGHAKETYSFTVTKPDEH